MRTQLFAAALLGLTVNAASLIGNNNAYAQIDDESAQASSLAEGASYVPTAATTITDAACEQMQGGVVVRLNTPECQLVKKPSADTLIMGAVQQLGKQAQELNDALKLAFERNQKLASAKTMKISGNLSISPMIDEPAVYELTTVPSGSAQPTGAVVATATPAAASQSDSTSESKTASE